MAEEEVSAASGAKPARKDILRAQAGGEELRAIGFGEIEADIARRGLVARGHHAEPLQRIGFVAGARLIEIRGGIRELRGEFCDEFRAHFIAAGANGRAESGQQVSRLAAEFEAHAADGLFGDAGERAFPTRMNSGDGAFFGIHDKDRNTIGGLHGEKHAGAIGDAGVPLARMSGCVGEKVNHVGVDLLQRRKREISSVERGLQEAAVFSDVCARVPIHEAEIKHRLTIEKADAAGPRAESVDEPGQLAKRRKLQDLQAA